MRKKLLLTIGISVLVIILGLGVYKSNAAQNEPKLSSGDIEEMVLSQYPGEITEMELEKDFNKVVYEVEVLGKEKEYELKLDGNTGEVLKLKEKTTSKGKASTNDSSLSVKEEKKSVDKEIADDDKIEKNNEKQTVLNADEVSKIALDEVPGTIKKIELDDDDGRFIYEIEILADHDEVEIEIDAITGEIIVIDIDD